MKLIDFDGLFDKKLSDYMEENAGKYTEKQWESLIPKLYAKFGDTYLKVADNTPKGYYAQMSDGDLIASLQAHIERDVPVSDFLCREIENRNCPDALLPLLSSENEQLLTVAINLSGANEKAFPAYFELVKSNANSDVVETVVEQLKSNADGAKAEALKLYAEGTQTELMLEILSRCKQKEEKIFEILMTAFKNADDELSIRASYLAAYGDERALPALLDVISREDINFLEFTELKYAVEALGGRYTEERDFSDDKYFLEVQAQSQLAPELFPESPKTDA